MKDFDSLNGVTDSILDILQNLVDASKERASAEEQKLKDPNWHYRRMYLANKEIFDTMLSEDTSIEVRIGLEWATFVGYQWVYDEKSLD